MDNRDTHLHPSFLIIGAQKAGTTSMYHYLSQHPSLVPSKTKEIHFFDVDDNYARGYSWYHSHFPLLHEVQENVLSFEVTPAYIYYPPCPERIYLYNQKIKLIVILRDPVERAFSAWNMFRNFKSDPNWFHLTEYRDFNEAIQTEMDSIKTSISKKIPLEPSYVRRGLYVIQLDRYLRIFSRNKIYITENKLFRSETNRILNEIIDFLEIPSFNFGDSHTIFNIGNYREQKFPIDMLKILAEFYQPYNERLFALIGKEFEWKGKNIQ